MASRKRIYSAIDIIAEAAYRAAVTITITIDRAAQVVVSCGTAPVYDGVPQPTELRFLAGMPIAVGLQLLDSSGAPVELAADTVEAPLLDQGVTPPVDAWAVELGESAGAVTLRLTAQQSSELLGSRPSASWPYTVWLNDAEGEPELTILHGMLLVQRPGGLEPALGR
jgi:hypothetical protein